MYLLIDDLRNTPADIIARTPDAAKQVLQKLEAYITCVIFDHDLGDCESGYDIMMWAINNEVLPRKVELVTSNPVGRDNMINALRQEGYKTKNNLQFYY